jgi:hypothetical protein
MKKYKVSYIYREMGTMIVSAQDEQEARRITEERYRAEEITGVEEIK